MLRPSVARRWRFRGMMLLTWCLVLGAVAAQAAEPSALAAAFERHQEVAQQIPLSFVYGGRPSSEWLRGCKRNMVMQPRDRVGMERIDTILDPQTGLEMRTVYTIYSDTPALEWTVTFTNRGQQETPILEQVRALDVTCPVRGDTTLHRLVGSECQPQDWLPLQDAVPVGKTIAFAPSGGWSSSGACPFFNVQWTGGGVITAIGWSGQWEASVERRAEELRIQAGMSGVHLKLRPGESIRGPRILQLYWFGDDPWQGYNAFRRLMFAHVMPRIGGQVVTTPIAHLSTSFYELNDSTEANVLSHLEAAKGLGFEVFWLDAYWTKNGFPKGMGNYGFPIDRVEPKDRFPRGLRPIGEAVHAAGLKFLVWFEPERVAPETCLAQEHPDWVISPQGDGGGLLNLGVPAAREYMTKYLLEVIRQYQLDWLRFDYNIQPLPYWQHLDQKEPDRAGMAQIRYVEGLYRMWDDLRAACPHLAIDDCASGGRRVDLETMSRSLPLWRSDNTCDMLDKQPATVVLAAMKNQIMTAGMSRYVPFSACGQFGASPYLFRSGLNAGISFGEDVRPAAYPREELRQAIAEAKRLRPYFFGDYYALSDVTTKAEDWCVWQYDRPEERDGMVMAFRRPQASAASFVARLRGIDPKADYEVTVSPSYERAAPRRCPGSELAELPISIASQPGSVVLEYKRLP